MAFNSNITLVGQVRFVNNQPPQTATGGIQEGGAITLFQSNAFLDGVCDLQHNHAKNGGAIYSTESKIYMNGNVTIKRNTAIINGGGIYLSNCELNCQHNSILDIVNNFAVHKGGGLHAVSSSIKSTSTLIYKYNTAKQYSGTRMTFTRNSAEKGGGLSLEANAKFYILKYNILLIWDAFDANTTVFTANTADYGGAVYISMMTPILVLVLATLQQNVSFKCWLSMIKNLSISRHRVYISHKILPTFQVSLSMVAY